MLSPRPRRLPVSLLPALLAGLALAPVVPAQASPSPDGLAPVPAAAAPQAAQTWTFDETTAGQDISWSSPTNVDPNGVNFEFSYTLTAADVTVSFSGIPFGPISALSMIPPEFQAGSASVAGPAPVTFVDLPIVAPAPPDPPAIAGTVGFGLDAGGFGFFTFTDVTLGTVDVDLGFPFGVVTADITSVRVAGTVVADTTQWVQLGGAAAGTGGVLPLLQGSGELLGNDPYQVDLTQALANTTATFILGLSELGAPFKGGVLVPSPDVLVFGIPTGPSGAIPLSATWPTGVPSGTQAFFQWWISDPAGVGGFSASNGLKAVAP